MEQNFSEMLDELKTKYVTDGFYNPKQNHLPSPKIQITETDFERLSKYEKATLRYLDVLFL